ncbi:MAG: restriction endonuclease subunit S [Bacteroidaceae bacterium]|nr:restriction endonuclease subunit S [Bacteroidaceae bacterium]
MKHGWEIKKLKDVCEILDSQRKPVTKKDRRQGCYPYYGATGIQDYVDSYIFDGRYLLVGEDGAKWGAYDKTAFIVEGKCWVNNHAHILKLHNNVIYKFAEYYLVFKDLNEFITGAIVQKLTQQALKNIPIPVPPLTEQKKIVEELDCLSGIIENKKQQLKEYDALAQSIFYEMFGNPIDNEKGWETNSLGEIANISSGGTPSRKKTEYFTGNINWYSAGELNNLYLPDSIEKITEEAINNSAAKVFKANSLMVGMYDTAAFKLGILRKDSASNQACANIDLHSDNVVWMYYLLSLMKEEALKHRHGIRQKNLNVGFIKSFVVPLPPIALQQEFASKIEAIEKQKELIKQSIAETETLFNSRMDFYFN